MAMLKKSQFLQLILTFLFGPLGLFYSSAWAAVGFLIAAIAFGLMTAGLALVAIWPITMIVGLSTVDRHNRAVWEEERRHQELVGATKSTTDNDKQ